MTSLEKMQMVDSITDTMAEEIGRLTKLGLFTFAEGVEIIKMITDKQMAWLKENFTEDEYRDYMIGKMGLK